MKQVGITGGIGSGKTLVCSIFERLGYLVYHADERSKALLMNDPIVIARIREEFGEKVFGDDGMPDRKKLAALVFKKANKLKTLNGIMHPAVQLDYQNWLKEIPASYGKSFVLKEAAILYEAGTASTCDAVVEIFAPRSLRIERVTSRDKVKTRDVIARMENQWPESLKLLKADYAIFNDGEHAVIPQVMACAAWLEEKYGQPG